MTMDQWQAHEGRVAASRAWTPACSFMADTAAGLAALLRGPRPGVLHLDSNAEEAHSFDRIAAALKQTFGRHAWVIAVNEDYHDQRLVGGPGSLAGFVDAPAAGPGPCVSRPSRDAWAGSTARLVRAGPDRHAERRRREVASQPQGGVGLRRGATAGLPPPRAAPRDERPAR